jgi:3-oxoacyl-[acyl-carrier-protein] synthase II
VLTVTGSPCIVGWSVISPIGIGREAFTDALLAGRSGRRPPDDGFPAPLELVCSIPEFETVAFLGPRGTRSMDRLTALVVATSDAVLREHETTGEQERDALGMVLGTSTGSVASITDFIRDTFVQEKPYFVNPAAFPNTVMNCAAGQSAIWHRLRGLNSTVSGGRLTGLLALRYASRMIRRGYAETLLVGAVEELSGPVAWADLHVRDAGQRRALPPGEGCAMLLVDDAAVAAARGRRVLAEVVAFEFAMPGASGAREGLAARIRAALASAGAVAEDVRLVSASQCGGPARDAAERGAVEDALAGATPGRWLAASSLVGNCFSASGAFQVAAVLAVAERFPAECRGLALVTSMADDGAVACALLRC